jgi:hypothetical protein
LAILTLAVLARPAAGAPATKPADPASDLKALGVRAQADLVRRFPPVSGTTGEIPAIGSCTRLSAGEREALTKLVTKGINPDNLVSLAFGCNDTAGIVIDIAFDEIAADNHRTGVWQVLRASAPTATASLTTLYRYEGESMQDFMEWSNEVVVNTQALVDVDGDGKLDALIASDAHEGGAQTHYLTLRLWRSRDQRIVDLGTYDDTAFVVPGSRAPFVIAAQRRRPEDGTVESRYRCVSAAGVVDLCPAVVQARHIMRMFEIASWFVDGHEYGPMKSPVPDRELAAKLMTELEVPASVQGRYLAELPPTTAQIRVARVIEDFLAPAVPRKYGEVVEEPPPADRRPAKLQALLGDAPCVAAPSRVASDVEQWIRSHDAEVLVTAGECERGKPCRWTVPTKPEIADSCVDGARGYALATWSYDDIAQNERLGRSVLFSLAPTLGPVATATHRNQISICAACGDSMIGNSIDVELHRRGSHLIATVFDVAMSREQTTGAQTASTFVDGIRAAAPPAKAELGRAEWSHLGEPDVQFKGLLQASTGSGIAYLHFDGASWQQVVEIPYGTTATLPASASGAARYLFGEQMRRLALGNLRSFELTKWASDPAVRTATHHDLVTAGASAAVLAAVDAEAAAM